MSEPVTIEDIYKLFEKTNQKFEQSRLEYDRRMAEIAAEADRRKAELDSHLAQISAEADRRSAETARSMEELRKKSI